MEAKREPAPCSQARRWQACGSVTPGTCAACSGTQRTSCPLLYGALTLAEVLLWGWAQQPSHHVSRDGANSQSAGQQVGCLGSHVLCTRAQEAPTPPQSWAPSFPLRPVQPPDQAGGPQHPAPVWGSPWPWGGCGAEAGSAGSMPRGRFNVRAASEFPTSCSSALRGTFLAPLLRTQLWLKPQQVALAQEGAWSLSSCATSTASYVGAHYSPFCWGCPEILVNP